MLSIFVVTHFSAYLSFFSPKTPATMMSINCRSFYREWVSSAFNEPKMSLDWIHYECDLDAKAKLAFCKNLSTQRVAVNCEQNAESAWWEKVEKEQRSASNKDNTRVLVPDNTHSNLTPVMRQLLWNLFELELRRNQRWKILLSSSIKQVNKRRMILKAWAPNKGLMSEILNLFCYHRA